MDETYALHATRYFVAGNGETLLPTGVKPTVVNARSRPYTKDKRVDSATWADLRFDLEGGKAVESKIYVDMDQPNLGEPFTGAMVSISAYVTPLNVSQPLSSPRSGNSLRSRSNAKRRQSTFTIL